jgi:hypothetical protein
VQRGRLVILVGECNYLFRYSGERDRLEWVEQDVWRLDFMKTWREEDIKTLLDIVADALSSSAKVMRLKCQIIR